LLEARLLDYALQNLWSVRAPTRLRDVEDLLRSSIVGVLRPSTTPLPSFTQKRRLLFDHG
jgi:hypothetical protein